MHARLKPRATLAISGMMALFMVGLGGCATSPQRDDAQQFGFNGTTFAPPPEAASWAEGSEAASEPTESEWAQRTYTLRSSQADARM